MNPDELNKRFCELAGICKTCDDKVCQLEPSCCFDFSSPIEVLRVMDDKGMLESFMAYVFDEAYPPYDINNVMLGGDTLMRIIRMILTPNALLAKAVEFMENNKQKGE